MPNDDPTRTVTLRPIVPRTIGLAALGLMVVGMITVGVVDWVYLESMPAGLTSGSKGTLLLINALALVAAAAGALSGWLLLRGSSR